jgi:molecular chaperone DnaK
MSDPEPFIGIDLGTTNSVVATVQDGVPRVIAGRTGQILTPSMVAVAPNGKRLVGHIAKRQAVTNAGNTAYAVKRLIGRRWGSREVEDARKVLPYPLVPGPDGNDVRVVLGGRTFAVAELSAMILAELKADAEVLLGRRVTKAVITVPAYFNDGQRQATKDAGRIAGLEVIRIINEPTSAALAYGFGKQMEKKVAVFDLGGGTFDISILDIGRSVYDVVAVGGDTYLGGEDFDRRVMDWLVFGFAKEHQGIDLRQDRMALQRLKEAAEKAKIELSTTMQSEINLPFITADASGPKHLQLTLSRAKLEQLVDDLIQRTIAPCQQAMRDAKLTQSDIEQVVLVGGMTRMPAVQEAVRRFFGKEPHKGVNPDEVVALGAAIQAGVLTGEVKDVLLLDVTPLTLSIETLGGVATPLIERNTTIPTKKSQIFSTAANGQTQVEIHVLQGERTMAADNKTLGKFILDGIPPAPRGIPQIEVTFDIDADGILHVTAHDKATGRQQSITITASSGLAKDEVERMVRAAEQHRQEDQQRRDEVESRNQADSLIYQAEKLFSEQGDKIPAPVKTEVEGKIAAVRSALQGQDVAAIKRTTQELAESMQKIGASMYQQPGSPPPPGPEAGDEDVVDGEYRQA